MNETTTRVPFDADRTFLAETESLLAIYEAMHGLQAMARSAPQSDGIVWAREIATPTRTVAITATRASIDARSLHVRLVSAQGPFVLEDYDSLNLTGLALVLEKLI